MPLSTHPDLADLIVRNVKAYAIVVLSEDGVVPEWSGDTQAVTGYAAGDIVGRSFDILFTKPDRAAGVAAQEIELALRDGRASLRSASRTGSRSWGEGSSRSLDSGDPRCIR